MSSFSDTLVKLRKQDGLTQVEAARKMGISRSALSMYETGQREPDFETLEVIADFYNVDLNTLVGGTCAAPSEVIPARTPALPSSLAAKLARLDAPDQEKVEAYADGLLAADKYKKPSVS